LDSSSIPREDETYANPNNIHFYLFTLRNQENKNKQEIFNTTESLDASNWDRNAPVKIFSHGFASTWNTGASLTVKNAYVKKGYPTDVNVVVVSWGLLAAAPWYDVAARGTKLVGEKIAYLVDFLVSNEYTTLDKIHLSGHSLGSHVSGFAGSIYQQLRPGNKIPRVTALDPALPLFDLVGVDRRLDATDADFVDVIHTASGSLLEGGLAFTAPLGHVDYYPNKGRYQPGCIPIDVFGVCSHMRVIDLFAESIQSQDFVASKCDDQAWRPIGKDKFSSCDASKGTEVMGEWGQTSARGIFYLKTKARSPFPLSPSEW
jgi:hypothetical protein